jgi:hypothetical protein
MKKLSYVLLIVLALSAMLVSACGAKAATSAVGGGSKPLASPVEFTGVIESMVGNEWTVNGQKITVDPAVVLNGPFKVGDTVKVEVKVQADGSMVVNRIEAPVAVDNSNDAINSNVNANSNDNSNVNSNDNGNVNSNDSNSNDDNSNINSNDSNSNDDNSNVNSNDDSSNDNSSKDSNSNDDKSKDDNGNGGNDDGGGNSNDD